MAETKTPEAILQEALTAAQNHSAQLERDLAAEREARGKTEQQLRDAETLIDQLNRQANDAPAKAELPTATHGTGKEAKTYRILVPKFQLAGHGVVEAKDVKSNSDVLAALVKAGSKVLELVTAK